MLKKALSVALCLLLCLCAFAFTAAEDKKTYTSADYTYTLLSKDTAEITNYSGAAEELSVPAELDGYAITSIGKDAFYGCEALTSITIPGSVTSIGESAFSWCDALTLTVAPGSFAEQYAQENGIKYICQ